MIRIEKPDPPPAILQTRGVNKRRAHSVAFAQNPGAFRTGQRTFDFDDTIYGDDAVRKTLIEAQHRKCCFCESLFQHVTQGDGDVDHFRPKAGYRQTPEENLQRPGYYWLAYEWTNLFLSCPLCNRVDKKNLFPLQDPGDRATSHREDIETEDPLLLNPGRDEPENHIGFREATAFPRNGSERGRRTIKALQLNQDALYEMRRDYYDTTFKQVEVILRALRSESLTTEEERTAKNILQRLIEQIREEAQRDDKPYASMLRDAVERFAAEAPFD